MADAGSRRPDAVWLTARPDPGQLAFLAAVFFAVLFLAAVFLDAVFFAAAFLAGAFFAPDFFAAVFLAGAASSSDSSPRAVFAAATERWSAASRSTTSPEVLVEV